MKNRIAISTNNKSHGYLSVSSLESCHGSNLFDTFSGNYLLLILNHCHSSLFNVVNALTLKFESLLNSGKIGEEGYNIVPVEISDSAQANHVWREEINRLLTL
ncbi:hypothetical protein AVEN_46674-1 [Araneus ventricosus]|uniref:Uncharacterized protein n=1 Tax=Araneus ventricosus TaxID=182803 RepID=A0A4Y2TC88_ARAVE|nr:hypothetical protein AVEN_46674-1 [Araneus ventricosus]